MRSAALWDILLVNLESGITSNPVKHLLFDHVSLSSDLVLLAVLILKTVDKTSQFLQRCRPQDGRHKDGIGVNIYYDADCA